MSSIPDADFSPDETARRRPDPFSLIIFGASGDLARRKLVPAVCNLFQQRLFPEKFSIFGFARTDMDDAAFAKEVRKSIESFQGPISDENHWNNFAERLHYQRGDYDDAESFRALSRRLAEDARKQGRPDNRLFDLATPPEVFARIVTNLGETDSANIETGWKRLIVEKPFGSDLDSALELNRRIKQVFPEESIFRIDHYLGKEAVQNILVFRFANSIFDPLWNQKYIDHVQITISESIGMEGRGGYYERSGALRDMVQNHMLHLLCFLAMESPVDTNSDSVRDEKVKVLKALRRIPANCADNGVVRAQYLSSGKDVPGYRQEKGVAPDSTTETFVAFRTFIDNWRWAGVPFYFRTGKRLAKRVTRISIHFKPVPQVLFNADSKKSLLPNALILRIQPNEGISLRFQVKTPGIGTRIQPYQMNFGYDQAFHRKLPDAYERLLLDAALGDQTLFIRSDEVEAAWRFVNPIIQGCGASKRELAGYPAGSWGPKAADDLIEADGRKWDDFQDEENSTSEAE